MFCALINPVPDEVTDLGLMPPVMVFTKTISFWLEGISAIAE
jgi:hypothetical protein